MFGNFFGWNEDKPKNEDLSKGYKIAEKRKKHDHELQRFQDCCKTEEKKKIFLELEAFFSQHEKYSKYLPSEDEKSLDDPLLLLDYHSFYRFLESNNWNPKVTRENIEKMIEWRLSTKPYLLTPDDVLGDEYTGLKNHKLCWIHGKTKDGKGITWLDSSQHNVFQRNYEICILFTIFTFETGLS